MTEAIGTLYGDEDDSGSDSGRPLSFVGGPSYQDQIYRQPFRHEHPDSDPRRQLIRSQSDQTPGPSTSSVEMGSFKKSQTLPMRSTSQRAPHTLDHGSKSPGGSQSPTPSLRDFQADASQFPLTNIDNPSDIAQELSNLQALRRLSMDVGSMSDPDMPPMTLSTIPAIAPSGDDDENDPSRLLWVPARVHPELAPSEFQTFLEKRVQSIRRRSGDSMLSAEGDAQRSDSGSSLSPGSIRRTKSKLSRQIDNSGGRAAMGYVDGAERLERKRSQGHAHSRELSLDELVKDPTKAVQKLAQESQEQTVTGEGSNDDKPILPMAPGMGLRRSTRTTYRKGGSLRSGDRPFSRRQANRHQENDAAEVASPPIPEAPPGHGLTRVQSEPIADNYSRPNRAVRRQNNFSQEALPTVSISQDEQDQNQSEAYESSHQAVHQDELPIRSSSSTSRLTGAQSEEANGREDHYHEHYGSDQYGQQQGEHARQYPQRSSSQATDAHAEQESVADEPPPRSSRRAAATGSSNHYNQPQNAQNQYSSRTPSSNQPQNLSDSLAAGSGAAASRTDNLTFIPTLNQEDRRSDRKSKRDDDTSSVTSTKSSGSGWKWFKSGEEKEKRKEESKKSKTKSLVEKAQDNVRLDVIQSSIDKNAPKGRESIVLDRENADNKLQEERKKEGSRKSDGKKEKDGNIFSSIFGGSKRKEEKEKTNKKNRHLEVPEEPVYKPLQPDVDYHWTRFPLLEERAIYRMAHIKLANPRRSLLSQVLLSNFMYSYLAIVQAMHPQMNVPTSPQQKRLEEEARRKQQEEEYLAQQQMQDDQDSSGLDQYDYDYHRVSSQSILPSHDPTLLTILGCCAVRRLRQRTGGLRGRCSNL